MSISSIHFARLCQRVKDTCFRNLRFHIIINQIWNQKSNSYVQIFGEISNLKHCFCHIKRFKYIKHHRFADNRSQNTVLINISAIFIWLAFDPNIITMQNFWSKMLFPKRNFPSCDLNLNETLNNILMAVFSNCFLIHSLNYAPFRNLSFLAYILAKQKTKIVPKWPTHFKGNAHLNVWLGFKQSHRPRALFSLADLIPKLLPKHFPKTFRRS